MKASSIVKGIALLVLIVFAVIGVVLFFDNSDEGQDATTGSRIMDSDGNAVVSNSSDPRELGSDVNSFLGRVEQTSTLVVTDAEGEQITVDEITSYLSDADAQMYLRSEQVSLYIEWRDEHYDQDGNQIKDLTLTIDEDGFPVRE